MSVKVDNSDDEAPESVSFTSSRDAALQVLTAATEISKGTSQKQRRAKEEKRKRRQDRRALKAKDTERTVENMAKLNQLREQAKEALPENSRTDGCATSKPAPVKNFKKTFAQDEEENDTANDPFKDYIPLGDSKLQKRTFLDIELSSANKLRVELVQSKKPKVLAAESVLNFRETMLYGAGSRVKREPTKKVMARREKMKLSGKAVFCKD